jgi:hypothetical protein
MAASSSSLAPMPPSEQSNHGIELSERKSAQFGTREIFEQQQIDGSDDYEDVTRSTNVDRHGMERMGKIDQSSILFISLIIAQESNKSSSVTFDPWPLSLSSQWLRLSGSLASSQ